MPPTDELLRLARNTTLWNVGLIASAAATAIATVGAIRANDRLQEFKDEKLNTFQVEAKRDIANADARAAEANLGSAEATRRANSAVQQTETARLEQEHLRNENLKLQSRVEEERTARLTLEQKLAPRRVSASQAAIFKNTLHLSPFHNTPITVTATAIAPDGMDFANDLVAMLKDCGFNTTLAPGTVFISGDPKDLELVAGRDHHKMVPALAAALLKAGLASKPIAVNDATADADRLGIIIGVKKQ
ncbi:MAG: hypothetical protein JWO20_2780 [Candidatus Angelobacter sp.]|nr:hypothetical protein [Candidatus Angelobacter sp.]